MTALTLIRRPPASAEGLPPLEMGDRLDQPTFHARYEAMPPGFRAELIGGMVYVPSPLKALHGGVHGKLITWLTLFEARTPGVRVLDNATHILSEDCELQPDASLLIVGGQTREADGYIQGAPEFVAEVASSSEAYDLHGKRQDYERHGVREYLVLLLREPRVVWLVREGDRFVQLAPGPDGILRSPFLKGLWLDPAALLRGDTQRVIEILNAGLATPEHAEFVGRVRPGAA